MERALVTGAGGFVGQALVRHLLSNNHAVRAMAHRESSVAPLKALGAEVVTAELKDPASLARALEGVTHVYHIAALFRQAGVPDTEYFAVNVDGTRNLFEAAVASGVSRIVHCSTGGVLGQINNPPANEETATNPGDLYQESKLQGELVAREFFSSGKVRGAVIRPGMIYGPGDDRLLKLFKMVADGRFFYVGKGDALVHFIDVRDLARAFEAAMLRAEINNEVFLIAGDTSLALNQFVKILCSVFGNSEPWLHLPVRPMQLLGDVCEAVCKPFGINPPIFRRRVDFFTKDRFFDTAKARRMLGFKPQQSLVGEIMDIVNAYVEAGTLSLPHHSTRPTMVRSVDGIIQFWDRRAEQFYGWTSTQALGSSSHSLLRTEFPTTLTDINQALIKKGEWRGRLQHVSRDGTRFQVDSCWKLIRTASSREPIIIETNTGLTQLSTAADSVAQTLSAAAISPLLAF